MPETCAHTILLEAVALTKGIDSAKRLAQIKKAQRGFAGLFRRQGILFMRAFPRFADRFLKPPIQEAMDEDVIDVFADVFDTTRAQAEDLMAMALMEGISEGYLGTATSFGVDLTFSLKPERAIAWAKQNAAAKVTGINQTTMQEMRGLIARGLEEGTSYGEVARQIKGRWEEFAVGVPQEHLASRAELVAVNENRMAFEAGGLEMARDIEEAGITMEKAWDGTNDQPFYECEICAPNAEQGWIPIDEAYKSGDMHPPGHPACRCAGLHRMKTERDASGNPID